MGLNPGTTTTFPFARFCRHLSPMLSSSGFSETTNENSEYGLAISANFCTAFSSYGTRKMRKKRYRKKNIFVTLASPLALDRPLPSKYGSIVVVPLAQSTVPALSDTSRPLTPSTRFWRQLLSCLIDCCAPDPECERFNEEEDAAIVDEKMMEGITIELGSHVTERPIRFNFKLHRDPSMYMAISRHIFMHPVRNEQPTVSWSKRSRRGNETHRAQMSCRHSSGLWLQILSPIGTSRALCKYFLIQKCIRITIT